MTDPFAPEFEALFRATYLKAVRRIRDKRERLSPESVAFLDHLAAAGPMSLGEIARHIGRAASTLSEMVDHLVAKGLLTRDRDEADARRSLIWLTDAGQAALIEARNVLETAQLAAAGAALTAEDRAVFLDLYRQFVAALPPPDKEPDHEP
jgi:DNA-binding MarR family transcriptional regulator